MHKALRGPVRTPTHVIIETGDLIVATGVVSKHAGDAEHGFR
jgi:hypothetical protein